MMEQIKGVNLGNWLVLEKWMSPALFDGTTAEDEYYLPTQLSRDAYEARIKIHRSEYISERDFATIARIGLNTVRIPIPYFIYGDRPPFIGCIEELDKVLSLDLIGHAKALADAEQDAAQEIPAEVLALVEHAFDFMEAAFGESTEMVYFITELSVSPGTADFLDPADSPDHLPFCTGDHRESGRGDDAGVS